MAKINTSAEDNPEENFNFEGYNNEDTGNNESKVLDFDPDSSDCIVLYWALDIAHYRLPMYY